MDELKTDFIRLHGSEPRIFRAPGRVNLIGEHTDYNGGFVLPAAIGFVARAAVASRTDRVIEVHSRQYSDTVEFDPGDANPAPRKHWSDYVRGVCIEIERSGRRLQGANLIIDGNVPIGAGLSSSAAIEVATALAMLGNSHLEMDLTEIALLCQRAENNFVGARSGIMDQFVSCHARAGHALLLDCRSLAASYEPVPDHLKLVICDTRASHELAAGEYNVRRAQCESAVEALRQFMPGIQSLRDIDEAQLNEYGHALDPVIYRRARHVVTENARVLAAARALDRGDLKQFGSLMMESHRSLRDDYEVSSRELDTMVEIALDVAREIPGVYGARMTGGGFGGCTVNLVESESAQKFAALVSERYDRAAGKAGAAYICSAAEGAREEI